FAISRPIVLTSPMDGSPQVVRFDATTLWHFDAAEWAPSTASKAACCHVDHVRFAPESGHARATQRQRILAVSGLGVQIGSRILITIATSTSPTGTEPNSG